MAVYDFFSLFLLASFSVVVQGCITSSFDSNHENWLITGLSQPTPSYNSLGGNPGGFISASVTDRGTNPWYFVAPANKTFRGDKKAIFDFDGILTYDINVSADQFSLPIDSTVPEIVIVGDGLKIAKSFNGLPATGWTNRRTDFSLDAGWLKYDEENTTLTGGALATLADIAKVLSYIKCVWIRGGFSTDSGVTGLDNVRMCQCATRYDFNNDAEGWTLEGQSSASSPDLGTYQISGTTNTATPGLWSFINQASANLSNGLPFYGGILGFSINLTVSNAAQPVQGTPIISIVGQSNTLIWPGVSNAISLSAGVWNQFTLKIDESNYPPWYVISNANPNGASEARMDDFITVLQNVASVEVLGYYQVNSVASLSDVLFCDGAQACGPNQALICSGVGTCVNRVCICPYGRSGTQCEIKSSCATTNFQIGPYIADWKS